MATTTCTPARRARAPLSAASALVGVLLAACSSSVEEVNATGTPSDTADDRSTANAAAPADTATRTTPPRVVLTLGEGVELPAGPAGAALGWVFDTLNAPEGPTPEEAQQRFAPTFLEQVPAEEIPAVFDQLRGMGSMRVDSIVDSGSSLAAKVDAPQPLDVTVRVDDQGQIDALAFAPDPTAGRAPATSFEQATTELDSLGSQAHVLAARVEDGMCVPVHEQNAEQPAPLGSVFKLYVLGALADAVERGEVAWEDELEITADLQSLPSGELQDRAPGTTVTVREAAELMISISDNTATDLLIAAVGVDTIQAALPDLGLQDSEGLVPLLTTAQFFRLGWDSDPTTREAWSMAGSADQQMILKQLPPGVEGMVPLAVTEPRWEEDIDWFASADEICALHVALQERADTEAGAPVREILAVNPGLPELSEGLDYLGFKGGSAPGVVAFSWYAESPGGDPVVAVIQVAGGGDLNPLEALGPAADVLRLLTEDPGR